MHTPFKRGYFLLAMLNLQKFSIFSPNAGKYDIKFFCRLFISFMHFKKNQINNTSDLLKGFSAIKFSSIEYIPDLLQL